MNAKRLEEGSEYAEYDADGDGVVTDAELQTSKELQELRLQHERADAQRAMSWFALWGCCYTPAWLWHRSWANASRYDSRRHGCGLLRICCGHTCKVLWGTGVVK